MIQLNEIKARSINMFNEKKQYINPVYIFWAMIVIIIFILACTQIAFGETATQQVNFTMSNQTVTITTPTTQFQTTCGQDLQRSFDVTHTYSSTTIINSSTVLNTSILQAPPNCTITYNITTPAVNTTSCDLLIQSMNISTTRCDNMSSAFEALLTRNVSDCDIAQNISLGLEDVKGYLHNTVFRQCQDWQYFQESSNRCLVALNLSEVQRNNSEGQINLLIWIVIIFGGAIAMITIFVFGSGVFRRINLNQFAGKKGE